MQIADVKNTFSKKNTRTPPLVHIRTYSEYCYLNVDTELTHTKKNQVGIYIPGRTKSQISTIL